MGHKILSLMLAVGIVGMVVGRVAAQDAPGTPVAAAVDVPKLGIRPVGSRRAFFAATVKPGQRTSMTVELGNFGTAKTRAKTYAADVFTLINGGLGVQLDGAATSGATTWLDYKTDILELETGETVQRTFTVTVPHDAKPAEYATSLVIQTADPVKVAGSATVNQVLRQAIAVAITVPGPARPRLDIQKASYELTSTSANLFIAIKNSGNVRLKPQGEVVLTDEKTKLSVEKDALPLVVASANFAGTPTASTRISIQSVKLNELRDPSSDKLQAVEFAVTIDNPSLPVANAGLTLHVVRDGQTVEDLALASSLSFAAGSAEVRQRYVPLGGWTPGTYAFSVTLEVTDPATGQVTKLDTAEGDATVTVT